MESIAQKRCPKCGEWKALLNFSHDKKGTNGLRCYCKVCISTYGRKYRATHHEEIRARSAEYSATNQEEIRARKTKYRAEHPEEVRASNAKYSISHRKEICVRSTKYNAEHPEKGHARAVKYRAMHFEEIRARNLKRRFGMTIEEYNQLLVAQNGVCAICGKLPKSKRLLVDHNHNSGRIRGLLCFSCNIMLGNAKDSASILAKAIDYLLAGTR